MRVKVVSGYIPLPIINITEERFRALGNELACALPCPYRFFEDDDIRDCWVSEFLIPFSFSVAPSDPNPAKDRFLTPGDMLLSNIVMHQKYEWLVRAAIEDPMSEVFVWIDYGVMKQPDMKPEVITNFIRKLEAKDSISSIYAPGIRGIEPIDDTQSWDRFCGSVVIVPRKHLANLCCAMKLHQMNHILQHHTVTIESNTLAHVEQEFPIPIRWYSAWWGATMFTNLP